MSNEEKNKYLMKDERMLLFYLNKYFYVLLIVVVTLILLAFYFFVISPQLSKSDVIRYFSYKSEVEQLDYLKRQKSEIKNILEDFNQFSESDLKQVEQLLPAEEEIPEIIAQLDTITSSTGLVLASLNINKQDSERSRSATAESGPKIQKLDITLNLSGGNYQQLKDLVSLIETNLRLMDVRSFGFSSDVNRGFIINLTTYFYK